MFFKIFASSFFGFEIFESMERWKGGSVQFAVSGVEL